MSTFASVQSEIAERLNLTSTVALARIGRSINERYKEALSSCGLQTSVRTTVTAVATIGNRSLVFANVEKLYSVFDATVTPDRVLSEFTFDEMRNATVGSDPPQAYAIQLMGATTVTIYLSAPPLTAYTLSADAEAILSTLSGSQVPAFPEKFHNLLYYGGMATELDKMEKYAMAAKQEQKYQDRLAELRLHIATSAYLAIYQAKNDSRRSIPLVS